MISIIVSIFIAVMRSSPDQTKTDKVDTTTSQQDTGNEK